MSDRKIIAENRKARFDYFIEDTYECGIVLEGTEVKSVKNGNISFPDAFAPSPIAVAIAPVFPLCVQKIM